MFVRVRLSTENASRQLSVHSNRVYPRKKLFLTIAAWKSLEVQAECNQELNLDVVIFEHRVIINRIIYWNKDFRTCLYKIKWNQASLGNPNNVRQGLEASTAEQNSSWMSRQLVPLPRKWYYQSTWRISTWWRIRRQTTRIQRTRSKPFRPENLPAIAVHPSMRCQRSGR